MLKNLIGPEIKEFIETKQWKILKETLILWEPADVAEFITDDHDDAEKLLIFMLLPKDFAAEVFAEIDADNQEVLLQKLSTHKVRELLLEMAPDDRTSIFSELPGQVTQRLMNLLPQDERKEALQLLGYPEDSIGRLMTPDYVAVRPSWTLEQALSHIRKRGVRSETINVVYVTDARWRFIAGIELKELIFAEPDKLVNDIIEDFSFVTLSPHQDREIAVKTMENYNLPALPVVDSQGVLVGIITFDDVMDVAQEETTEDFHKSAAIAPLDNSYLNSGILSLFSKRILWLLGLVFINIISGAILASFSPLIEVTVVLVFFLPLLIASAGNAGSQAATLVIRAIATNEVELQDSFKLIGKDLLVSLLLGVSMGGAVMLIGFMRGGIVIGVIVALSMVAVVLIGSIVGTTLPFLLKMLKLDPATASGPLVTSIADIMGVLIYFSIATALLPLIP